MLIEIVLPTFKKNCFGNTHEDKSLVLKPSKLIEDGVQLTIGNVELDVDLDMLYRAVKALVESKKP